MNVANALKRFKQGVMIYKVYNLIDILKPKPSQLFLVKGMILGRPEFYKEANSYFVRVRRY